MDESKLPQKPEPHDHVRRQHCPNCGVPFLLTFESGTQIDILFVPPMGDRYVRERGAK
jgi:hypothetical protein